MTDCEKAEQYVCISCVEEVRYSFVSHLSGALRRKGINDVVIEVDSDNPLPKESQEKIEKARVSVMVLPGDSEPTRVCLNNFVIVGDCHRNKDQVLVLYGDSLVQEGWLSVLDVGGLSSMHRSREECSDSKLVEEIVRDVYEKLFYMKRIGICSKLLEIEKMVSKQPLGIRRVGIWGMPGIGKTTLAKAVFDQMSGDFDACCFIEDYEKAVHEKGLYRLLEEQFLKEMPGTGNTITKLSFLRDQLNSKRSLVVLDDMRNALVAESFFEGFEWWGPESLIIITSRDKQMFSLCRINQVYEVQGLNENDALKLFLLCASIKDIGEQSPHELSMEVIRYADGNPLALSIYGRELKGQREPSEMLTTFLKLKQSPPFEIVDAIKGSYDTLSNSEKNIFRDIACFFLGENVDYAMQLLEGCGFFPHVGIDVLVEKCLVIISENCLQMHNLIRDIGREIINGETVQIERRSRLWEPLSIKYLLEDNDHRASGEPKTTFKPSQGTEEIEGMFLDASNLSFDIKPAAFENMLKLRLLKIYSSNPEIHPVINSPKASLHSLPNELRLLHWENYPLQSLPQNFDPRHLVEINMPYSQLQKLWGGTKKLEMLRTIRLCHSQRLVDIDDLLKAKNLEVIDLQGCTRLQSFPATGQLLHLRDVNLSGCREMRNFPEVPPNIETLHLQGTGIRKLPIVNLNAGELPSLSEFQGLSDALKLERLASLMKSSSSCQDLGKLICLELKDCSHLQSLPNMAKLEFLEVLDVSGCLELETIQGLPRNLKELYIAGTAVRQVPQLPQSLERLNANGSLLRSLPNVASLEFLKVLDLSGCSELETISGIPRNLKELYIAGTAVRQVPQLPQSLERLNANGSRLQSLPNMVNLEYLKVLDLSGCSELETIQDLPRNLKELYLTGTAVRQMPQLPESLELLDGAISLKSIPSNSDQEKDEHLYIDPPIRLFGVVLRNASKDFIPGSPSIRERYHGVDCGYASEDLIPGSSSSRERYHGVDRGYASEDFIPGSSSSRVRKKGNPWTEEEHRMFLSGLRKLGKGDWRGISRNYVISRTPTQVASHAQKYFIRKLNMSRRKRRRSSLFDMVPEAMMESPELQAENDNNHVETQMQSIDSVQPLFLETKECDSMNSTNSTVEELPHVTAHVSVTYEDHHPPILYQYQRRGKAQKA